jgi:DNA helicase-2/ATP-dependent DNA helicase PcrA
MNHLLKDLNAPQREAVETTEGPLLIIAGAGSGKTRVLTRRLSYILNKRLAEPYQLLAVTFTNKAAGEMKSRVATLLGTTIPELNVSTFHSFCARFLRKEAHRIGYDSSFTIFDADDAETLTKNCIKDLNLSGSQFTPRAQSGKISSLKNKLITASDFASRSGGYFEEATAKIYTFYQKRLRECNAMDFDDLLVNSVLLLRDFEEVGHHYRNRYKYIMVDEYQDTNHVQYLLLKYLLGEHKNISVVGDEDQSIYGWRGADIRNILEFEKDFPGAKIIKLEQNYRSTNNILNAASAVISRNSARKGKTLWSQNDAGEKIRLLLVDSAEEEAVHIVRLLKSQKESGTPLKQMVILYRTNAQSRAFEEQLRRNNLPYQIFGGTAFYQRKEIKDLLAYLKLIANPKDDISFQRVVNYPKRGIGDKSVSDISQMAAQEQKSSYELVLNIDNHPALTPRAKKLKEFTAIIEKYRSQKDSRPVDLLVQDLVDEIKIIDEVLSEDMIIGQTKVENVEAFIEGAAEYARHNGEATLDNYLQEISLFTDLDNYSEIDDKVSMMSIHSAKGLEYDNVFLVGLEEGLFPLGQTISDPMELEEERRLFYVGSTRARKQLVLSSASIRYRFGEVASIPSRFIGEIPKEYLEELNFCTRRDAYGTSDHSVTPFFSHKSHSNASNDKGIHYVYDENETFRSGRIVQHPTFGRGKILNTEGFGESLILEIMFTGRGVKKIMAKYAKLKVVG